MSTKVKHHWAQLVPGWDTASEPRGPPQDASLLTPRTLLLWSLRTTRHMSLQSFFASLVLNQVKECASDCELIPFLESSRVLSSFRNQAAGERTVLAPRRKSSIKDFFFLFQNNSEGDDLVSAEIFFQNSSEWEKRFVKRKMHGLKLSGGWFCFVLAQRSLEQLFSGNNIGSESLLNFELWCCTCSCAVEKKLLGRSPSAGWKMIKAWKINGQRVSNSSFIES